MNEDEQPSARSRALIGRVLRGKWTLNHLLGEGGMGAVYAGTHRNGSRGAIKLMHAELAVISGFRQRFLAEGRAANAIDHPGVVKVVDDDVTDDGSWYLVMELLEGETLEDWVVNQPEGVDLVALLEIANDVVDILAAAHRAGVIHRDLKPENIFLTSEGQVKLLDFGIARVRDPQQPGDPVSAALTRTGAVMGTPAYMPPEQARGRWEDVDARTDLWALGAVLFWALSGRAVHVAQTLNEVLLAAMTLKAPPLASVVSPSTELPLELTALVDRALTSERGARFQDARAMQEALRSTRDLLRGGVASSAVAPTVGERLPERAKAVPATLPDEPPSMVPTPLSPGVSPLPPERTVTDTIAEGNSVDGGATPSRQNRAGFLALGLALIVVGGATATWLGRTPTLERSGEAAAPSLAGVAGVPVGFSAEPEAADGDGFVEPPAMLELVPPEPPAGLAAKPKTNPPAKRKAQRSPTPPARRAPRPNPSPAVAEPTVDEPPAAKPEPAPKVEREPEPETQPKVERKVEPESDTEIILVVEDDEEQLPRFDSSVALDQFRIAASGQVICTTELDGPRDIPVQITFANSGQVSQISVLDEELAGTPVAACIIDHFKGASISPFSGPEGTIKFAVEAS
jgi:eukaryotic-like serine/threonine-protein kinase